MKYEQKFFTQEEAATKLGVSQNEVYYLVETERLPVCFRVNDELFNVSIHHPDGSSEQLPLAVPINGVLKSLLPPIDQSRLKASSVQIVRVGDRQQRHTPGRKLVADNYPIPTTSDPDKLVQRGFRVTGWVNFLDKPASEWLFDIDDLLKLSTRQKSGSDLDSTGKIPERALEKLDTSKPLGTKKVTVSHAIAPYLKNHYPSHIGSVKEFYEICRTKSGENDSPFLKSESKYDDLWVTQCAKYCSLKTMQNTIWEINKEVL